MPAKNNQGQSQCFGTVRMGVATYGVLMWDKHSPYLVSAVSAFSFTSKANNWTWMGVIDPTTFMDLQRDLSSVQICTGKDSFFLWVLAQFCKDAPYLGFLLYWEVFVGANHCQCSLMQSAVVQRLTLHRGSWKWAPKIGTWHENSPKWAVADFGGISWTETNPLSSKFMMWLKTFNWKYMYIYIYYIYSAISLTRCGLQCIATGSALNDLRSFRMLQAARCFVWTQRYNFHIIQKSFWILRYYLHGSSIRHHPYDTLIRILTILGVWRRRFRPFHSKTLQTKWRWQSMLTLRGHRGSLMNELLSAALSGLSASSR